MKKSSQTYKDDGRFALTVGNVKFRNNFVVASGPTVKWKEQLILAEESGWAGASLKLAFEPEPYISLPPRYRWFNGEKYHAFTAEKRLTFDQALKLLEEGRKVTSDLVLFANITYTGDKPGTTGWEDMARKAESAGAHIIELNMCCPNMSFNVALSEESVAKVGSEPTPACGRPSGGGDLSAKGRSASGRNDLRDKSLCSPPGRGTQSGGWDRRWHNNTFVGSSEEKSTEQTGASMGQNAAVVSTIAGTVKKAVNIPVFVKITPEGGRIAEVAKACFDRGIPCVASVANRLAIAEFDIENVNQGPYRLQDEPTLACFSGPWIKPLALRDVYEIRKKAGVTHFILGTGGIASAKDAIQFIMCGADLVGVCTETMLHGFDFLPKWLKQMREFMDRHGYKNYRDFRDMAVPKFTSADKLTLHEGYAEVDSSKCNGCGLCEKIGHCDAIAVVNKKSRIAREKCLACSTCVDVCPKGAIRMRSNS